MRFTRSQITEILKDYLRENDGVNAIIKLFCEALMKAEREEYKSTNQAYSNGYRTRKILGDKCMIEVQVPRTRDAGFYPIILDAFKDKKKALELACLLYRSGMSTEQVGEVFGEIYGHHYSSSQVNRMVRTARQEIAKWLARPIESYYPVITVDVCTPSHRGDSVSEEVHYTLLGIRANKTREVLSIYSYPTEESVVWEVIFRDLKQRGLREAGLVVSNGISNIGDALWNCFPEADIQLYVINLEHKTQPCCEII